LQVHNSLGQEIAELAGKEYSGGPLFAKFDGANPAGGTYFCAVKAGNLAAHKMILEK
jgi:hypothetical protein